MNLFLTNMNFLFNRENKMATMSTKRRKELIFFICLVALGACLIYLAVTGWYLSVADVLFLVLDIFIMVMFGTALSSIINLFLSSEGQISAVGTIVSSGYGFVCGAYMPISSFSPGLQKVICFLPGTYGTALMRNHAMQGALAQMEKEGIPAEFTCLYPAGDSVRQAVALAAAKSVLSRRRLTVHWRPCSLVKTE